MDSDKIKSRIAKNFNTLLSNHNMKKGVFEETFGLSQGQLTKYLNAKTFARIDLLVEVSNYFKVPLELLVNGEVGRPNAQYDEFVRQNHPDLLKDTEPEPYNKDQIIKLLQEKLELVESQLPKTLGEVVKKEIRNVLESQDVFGKTLTSIGLSVDEMKEKMDKLY